MDWVAYKIEDLQELLKLIGEVHQSPEMYSEGHMTELAADLKDTSGQLIAALEEQSVSATPESFLDDFMNEVVGPLGPRRSKKAQHGHPKSLYENLMMMEQLTNVLWDGLAGIVDPKEERLLMQLNTMLHNMSSQILEMEKNDALLSDIEEPEISEAPLEEELSKKLDTGPKRPWEAKKAQHTQRERWMQEFNAVIMDQHPAASQRHDYWDTATYYYNEGEQPGAAAISFIDSVQKEAATGRLRREAQDVIDVEVTIPRQGPEVTESIDAWLDAKEIYGRYNIEEEDGYTVLNFDYPETYPGYVDPEEVRALKEALLADLGAQYVSMK